MPKPTDFTGFSYLFMINFLSTCGKIEVSTPSHSINKWRRKFMPVTYKYRQISLKDIFSDCQDMFVDDAHSFFQLLHEHFDIQEFIPSVFCNAFYQHFGRKRDYPLEGFLSALILQKSFPSTPIPFCSFFSACAGNSGISAAFPGCRMLLSSPSSNRTLSLILNSCLNRWWTIQNPSAG